jgi:hypothetical protein
MVGFSMRCMQHGIWVLQACAASLGERPSSLFAQDSQRFCFCCCHCTLGAALAVRTAKTAEKPRTDCQFWLRVRTSADEPHLCFRDTIGRPPLPSTKSTEPGLPAACFTVSDVPARLLSHRLRDAHARITLHDITAGRLGTCKQTRTKLLLQLLH